MKLHNKKMKKIILILSILTSLSVFAKINIGLLPGLTHSSQGIGFGKVFFASVNISEKFSLGGKVGYYFLGAPRAVLKQDMLLEGIGEYYFLKNNIIKPFFGLGTGFHFFNEIVLINRILLSDSIFYEYNKIYLLYGLSPSVGCDFNLSELIALHVSYTYSFLFTFSGNRIPTITTNTAIYSPSILQDHYGQLNLGVVFKLGK